MKKIFTLIFLLFFITACKNKNYYINTIIEKKDNCLVAITYPITNNKKLNQKIKEYIDNQYNLINTNTKELNIDYTFNIIGNRYINITLESNIYTGNNNYDIISYIFDAKYNKFLNLENIISENIITGKRIYLCLNISWRLKSVRLRVKR